MLRPVLLVAALLFACADTSLAQSNEMDASGKRIALSYDDAPRGDSQVFSGQARTAALIQQWKDPDVGPVLIFATTRGMEEASGRERIIDYASAGHLIANHSHSHMWASRTDVADYIADIDRAETLLTGLDNRRPWYRFPFLDEGGYGEDETKALAKRDAYREALAERGLMNGYVTVDTFDWHLDNLWQQALRDGRTVDRDALAKVYADMAVEAANHYDRIALDVLGRRPAHMLLLHENDLAAAFTKEMVAALRADGWTIIDPDTAYADPIASVIPATRYGGDGRVAAIAHDQGKRGAEYFDHWSSTAEGIEKRLEEAGVFSD